MFFGLVSGHDFSRATNAAKINGLQPLTLLCEPYIGKLFNERPLTYLPEHRPPQPARPV
jgi:hypothetical protein